MPGMSRALVIVVLLASAAMPLHEAETTITRSFDGGWNDHTEYTEVYRGKWAHIMKAHFNASNSSLEAMGRRTSQMEIYNYTIIERADELMIMFSGKSLGTYQKIGDDYKLESRGFVDSICQTLDPEIITAINQSFSTYAAIPEGYRIVSIPRNMSSSGVIDFSYEAWADGNTARWRLSMNTSQADVMSYCASRKKVQEAVTQGFIAAKDDSEVYAAFMLAGIYLAAVWIKRFADGRAARKK